ncbi:MAG: hypothetical protein HZB16_18340, partial [Armatimonadetes bacterium]|nr:hypothetical protein [Armatimonadota bacterium]
RSLLLLLLTATTALAGPDPEWYVKRATPTETYAASMAAHIEPGRETFGAWYAIGPFGQGDRNAFDTVYDPEKAVDLAAECSGLGGRKLRWQRMDDYKDGQGNDLMRLSGEGNVAAYVYREIEAPTARAMQVWLGSDDTLTVWLNGEKLLAKNVDRGCNLGDDRLSLPLKQGRNQLLLKIGQYGGGWAFAFSTQPQGPRTMELWALLLRDFPGQTSEVNGLMDGTLQFDRLEAQRSGRMPVSRFAKPEHVLRQEALLRPDDRDPVDIALRQTAALLADLSTAKGVRDLSAERTELGRLREANQATPVDNVTARRALHQQVCAVRRRIALANPLLDFNQIVFIKHKRNARGELGGDHMAGQYYGMHATPGEGLFVLDNAFSAQPTARNVLSNSVLGNGRLAGARLPDGAYLAPDLSFDGKRIVFAFTEAAGYQPTPRAAEDLLGMYNYSGLQCSFTERNSWQLFSVNVDGSDLRRITDGHFNDFDPCWLPNGDIAFISDRRGGFGRCHMSANGGAPWFTYTLHRVKPDGTDMVRLSHHETCEWQPSVANDGMIVYTRWDYVDRGFFQAHHPWKTMPDGRAAMAVHGNYPKDWKDRPCMEMDIRAVPGSSRWAATAAAHHGQTYGSLVLVDPLVQDDDAMAPVKLITPDERFPESEYGYFCREAAYATPWALSENYYLCVFGYPDPNQPDSVENYGLYLLDAFGNKELLYRDPNIACLSPIPLRARPKPPVIPDAVQPLRVDTDAPRLNYDRPQTLAMAGSASLAPSAALPLGSGELPQPSHSGYDALEPAQVTIGNVYQSRHAWPKDTLIKALRIVQILPKSTPGRNNPAIGYGTEKNARLVLGTVPVEADGSASFYLKPYVPVYLQALDAEGRAVQSMRSDIYAAPGEKVSCVGCHESRTAATPKPPATRPTALGREPSRVTPELDGSAPFGYLRLVQPVLDKHCVDCHAKSDKAPKLSGNKAGGQWVESYRNLKPFAFYYDGGGAFVDSKTIPGGFGALASGLYKTLAKGHYDVKLSPEEMRRITLWLDCNSDFYGTYERIAEQDRGEVVWPVLE